MIALWTGMAGAGLLLLCLLIGAVTRVALAIEKQNEVWKTPDVPEPEAKP